MINSIFGWLGRSEGQHDIVTNIHYGKGFSPESSPLTFSNDKHGLKANSSFGKHSIHVAKNLSVVLIGRPFFLDSELANLAKSHSTASVAAFGWQRVGEKLPTLMSGNFAIAIIQPEDGQAFLAIDRMGIERLCYAHQADEIVFGTRATDLASWPFVGRRIDTQALYDYLYFHAIPSPRTIYEKVNKLQPGQYLKWDKGKITLSFYWKADYTPHEDIAFNLRCKEFLDLLNISVDHAAGSDEPAAFLSGGTDSSTVVGVLTQAQNKPVDTFSIGFDAHGFDEMEYARCAVERYRSIAHEYYLKPEDIVTAIPIIANAYDEPFGNASAVPTYFCTLLAREAGFKVMLSGDGGDEIFGGNARYAKQGTFEVYSRLPFWLRRGVAEPLSTLPGLSSRFPLRKLKRYIEQANVKLPQRLETYNFLQRTPLTEIFEPEFLQSVAPSETDYVLTEAYNSTLSSHYINRMMHLDLKFTLADNDLRKVSTMAEIAGVEVRYPLLDDRLVKFANHLPVNYKVRGQQLRWFFKEALRDLLPEKIINKSKHGFGLPFGVWSSQHVPLKELVKDSMSDLGKRGWIKPAYLDHLLRMQQDEHASYFGVMIWVTMMLEQWIQANEST